MVFSYFVDQPFSSYDPTRITNIDGVCTSGNVPYTSLSAVQTITQINYVPGIQKAQTINAFTAIKAACNLVDPVFTYTGFDDTDRVLLTSTHCVQVAPTTGTITITSACLAGTTILKVIGKV